MSMIKQSAISFASGLDSQKHDDGLGYDEISITDLRQMLKQIVRTKWILKVENGLFERFLAQNDPHSLEALAQALESSKHVQKIGSHLVPIVSTGNLSASVLSFRARASPSASTSMYSMGRGITPGRMSSRVLKITLPQRIQIANKEIEGMRKQLHEFAAGVEKQRARLRAKFEEVELCIRETQAATEDFEENVIRRGVDPITGKIPAEKFVRFMENWLQVADTIIDRLRLKSYTIRLKIIKAKHQLVQREELGESLHAIDFEQIRIENQYYVKQIEEKNHCLLDMKKTAGFYSLELTRHKEKLSNFVSKLNGIKNDISQNKSQIQKLQGAEEFAVNEATKIHKQLQSLLALMDKYEVPDILDFLRVQEQVAQVNRVFKRLERERNIMRLTNHTQHKYVQPPSKNDESKKSRTISELTYHA